jgi:hypothetical protein
MSSRIPAKAAFTLRLLLGAAGLATVLTGPAFGQAYRCVQNGQVVYSQTRPREGQCDPIEVRAPAAPSADAPGSSLKNFSEQIDQNRAAQAKAGEAAKRQQLARQRACSQAKRTRTMLDTYGSRIFSTDANGNRTYMSEAEYEQHRRDTAEALRTSCD